MKYYLGQDFSYSYFHRVPLEFGHTGNILFSFASARTAVRAIETLKLYGQDTNFIIDSGAFSIWNTGGKVDRRELLKFYEAIRAYKPNTHFINLDVIPGVRGRKPNKTEALQACQAGWENYLWFKSQGMVVIPVFHEDDPWEYLYKMMEATDYIAISPANDSSVKRRMVWLDGVYSILKADYKTHGLAATSKQLLKRYPFYSVDSINWKASLMYGRSTENVLEQKQVSSYTRTPEGKQYMLKKELEYYSKLQAEITSLWAKRGVKWKD